MLHKIPGEAIRITCDAEEYLHLKDLGQRKLYLSSQIDMLDEDNGPNNFLSKTGYIIKHILDFNEEDKDTKIENRKPIRLFINSPGGIICEGFPLVSVIELSKTPVYTVNVGTWSSMAFWIGIAGHKRFALPYTEFLFHEGAIFTGGSNSAVHDAMDFNKRFNEEVIKKHVLRHSNMSEEMYKAVLREEKYMLPEDALRYKFIDRIVESLEEIM